MVAVKRNNITSCKLLLEKGAEVYLKNDYGLNAFDYSVLYCNYEISLYFKEKYKSIVKEIDYYLEQGNLIGAPLFNIKLYLDCLNQNIPLDKIPQFKLTREQNKGIRIIKDLKFFMKNWKIFKQYSKLKISVIKFLIQMKLGINSSIEL